MPEQIILAFRELFHIDSFTTLVKLNITKPLDVWYLWDDRSSSCHGCWRVGDTLAVTTEARPNQWVQGPQEHWKDRTENSENICKYVWVCHPRVEWRLTWESQKTVLLAVWHWSGWKKSFYWQLWLREKSKKRGGEKSYLTLDPKKLTLLIINRCLQWTS